MSDTAIKCNSNSKLLLELKVREEARSAREMQVPIQGPTAPNPQLPPAQPIIKEDNSGPDPNRVFIINGVKNEQGDDLKNAVVSDLNKWMPSLNNSLVKWSIATCERVSKAIGSRPGSIRVVVHEPWIKEEIFRHRRELKDSGIYLKEDLSREMRGGGF